MKKIFTIMLINSVFKSLKLPKHSKLAVKSSYIHCNTIIKKTICTDFLLINTSCAS